jgi:HSP20 family protein
MPAVGSPRKGEGSARPGLGNQLEVQKMLIRRTNPFGDLLSLRQAMDRLFEESFVNPSWQFGEGQVVPLDVHQDEDAVTVVAHLPGVKPEEVDITVEGETLTISGDTTQQTSEEKGQALLTEIRRGKFMRTLTLPVGLEADKASATFEDGVLTLRIPKAEATKPKQIRISSGSQNGQPALAGKH